MSGPIVRWIELPPGRFRVLEWPGKAPAVLLLHGLAGVAEVWGPMLERLGQDRPRSFAFDQRAHGHSPKPRTGYAVREFVHDLVGIVEGLGLERPHLAGHSMGGRIALAAAARHPKRFRSVAIIDIGPEQWAENWQEAVASFERLPQAWPDEESAIGRAARTRGAESMDAALATGEERRAIARARLEAAPGGGVRWLAEIELLKETVRLHRSRNYWREWEAVRIPALLVRGCESGELRPRVAEEMRRRNPAVRYEELPGVGHNVPLLAPGTLAVLLRRFWASA